MCVCMYICIVDIVTKEKIGLSPLIFLGNRKPKAAVYTCDTVLCTQLSSWNVCIYCGNFLVKTNWLLDVDSMTL